MDPFCNCHASYSDKFSWNSYGSSLGIHLKLALKISLGIWSPTGKSFDSFFVNFAGVHFVIFLRNFSATPFEPFRTSLWDFICPISLKMIPNFYRNAFNNSFGISFVNFSTNFCGNCFSKIVMPCEVLLRNPWTTSRYLDLLHVKIHNSSSWETGKNPIPRDPK